MARRTQHQALHDRILRKVEHVAAEDCLAKIHQMVPRWTLFWGSKADRDLVRKVRSIPWTEQPVYERMAQGQGVKALARTLAKRLKRPYPEVEYLIAARDEDHLRHTPIMSVSYHKHVINPNLGGLRLAYARMVTETTPTTVRVCRYGDALAHAREAEPGVRQAMVGVVGAAVTDFVLSTNRLWTKFWMFGWDWDRIDRQLKGVYRWAVEERLVMGWMQRKVKRAEEVCDD